jgi:hypothetical protein
MWRRRSDCRQPRKGADAVYFEVYVSGLSGGIAAGCLAAVLPDTERGRRAHAASTNGPA